MALRKKKELSTGVEGEYWRIAKVLLLPDSCACYLELYMNQASRLAQKEPLERMELSWVGEDNPCTADEVERQGKNHFKLCYAKLKQSDDFKDSEDL
jgi:hypothetical protein